MKLSMFLRIFLFMALSIQIPLSSFAQLPDTIKQIPFIETWESGTFDTNGWTFPYMQGNWTILMNEGNPSPCAAFPGTPSHTTYIYALQSPWLDATQLTCDSIFLSFNLKLETANPTGLEKFRVELETDSSEYTLWSFTNSNSFPWDSVFTDLSSLSGELFRLRFIAYGNYSPSLAGWFLDNISVDNEHKKPRNLDSWAGGHCSSPDSSCIIYLAWEPPSCNQTSQIMQFIFDDGTAENGWAINPGWLIWVGTYFPIDPSLNGVIQSVDVWFGWGPGTPGLSMDIFDGVSQTLLGSSATWTSPSDTWLNIPMPDVPFNGPFYAMVKWDNVSYQNFEGYDENGPYVATNLAWGYDGSAWTQWSTYAGTNPGVFMIRATANTNFDGTTRQTDSTMLIGYNIYYHREWDDNPPLDFVKINQSPVTDTFYVYPINCVGKFYITALYSDSIEMESNKTEAGCLIGIPEIQQSEITIKPNPVSGFVDIESALPFTEIRILDMLGVLRYHDLFKKTLAQRFLLPLLAPGAYLVSIQTETGPVNRKLIVQY